MSSPPHADDAAKAGPVFRTLRSIADGGMGSVELASYVSGPRAGQLVAVKRPHPHLERDPRFGEWFFEEARITAGLSHPNVVEIFEWGTDARGRFLALEFVSGDSTLALLRDAKRHAQSIPIGVALYIVRKTADGLHAAHELRNADNAPRGLVHRDVSPSNILLSSDGAIKLIDFGVAKVRDQLTETTTGAIKGKLGYVSPEQARGERLDRRSDLFALGVVLWELLAGRRLFLAEAHLELLRMVVSDPIAPIRSVRPDAPDALQTILDRALARERSERFATAAEFSDAIAELMRASEYDAGAAELVAFRASLPSSAADVDERDTASAADTRITQAGPRAAPRSEDADSITSERTTRQKRPASRVVRSAAVVTALCLAVGAWIVRDRSNETSAAPAPANAPAIPHAAAASSPPPRPMPTAPEPASAPIAPVEPTAASPAAAQPAIDGTHVTPRRHARADHVVAAPAPTPSIPTESPRAVEQPAPTHAVAPASPPASVGTHTGHSAERIFTPDWENH